MQKKKALLTNPNSIYGPILANPEKGQTIDESIMRRIVDQIDAAENENSKTFVMRFDLRFPKDYPVKPDNGHFRKFSSALNKNLSRNGLNPRYVAVREQKDSKHQHYHVGLLLNGQNTFRAYNHFELAERLWNNELGLADGNHGLVDRCDGTRYSTPENDTRMRNGIMLDPTKDSYDLNRNAVIRQLSYLAKSTQKDDTPKGQREYFASKLPPEYARNREIERKRRKEL